MRRVVLESPAEQTEYRSDACHDSLLRGEAPMLAVNADTADEWRDAADSTVVYCDLGITPGMQRGIADAKHKRQSVEYRQLPGWERKL